jgi:hypothetical protein
VHWRGIFGGAANIFFLIWHDEEGLFKFIILSEGT